MPKHARILAPAVVLAALFAACTPGQPQGASTNPESTTTVAPTTTMAPTTVAPTTSVAPVAGPEARGYLAMTTVDNNGVMLFGGFSTPPRPDGDGTPLLDAWLLATTADGWSSLSGAPLSGDSIAYDAQSRRVLAYIFFEADWRVVDPQLWAYDPEANQWEQMSEDGVPDGMWAPHLVYDEESDITILIGPPDPSPNPETATWAFDHGTDTWVDLKPANAMPRRWFPAMAYDPGCDRVIVFGGFPNAASDETSSETWGYDYNTNTWTDLAPAVSPSARAYAAMAYDPASQRMILFGGQPYPESIGDTWAYECESNLWTELLTDVGPSQRGKHAMAYNPIDGKIVLFGGATIVGGGPKWEALPAETWIFDPADNTWTRAS
ncbi:MAG TPA: kelch repeat-containing protein [Acidimicrobiia bacterium]|nr:kelch repeat-containing protein [Acidimicrobiia bacterium]